MLVKLHLRGNSNTDIVTRYKDFKSSWAIRKESTSTHHLHIGHYKAALKHQSLSWFLFQRADLPQVTGYSPLFHQCQSANVLCNASISPLQLVQRPVQLCGGSEEPPQELACRQQEGPQRAHHENHGGADQETGVEG